MGVHKCIRYGQLACFGRHYECWKVYKGLSPIENIWHIIKRKIRQRRPRRLLNSFFPQAVRALNWNHPAPLWNPMQTPTSWNMDHLPPSPNTPQPYHTKERNCMKLFCAIQSVLHTGEWAIQTTFSNTLSSMRTRHFSHTAVCTQSHKRLSNICMFTCSCTTNHLALVPQPAAWLTMFLSAYVQYLCEAFV